MYHQSQQARQEEAVFARGFIDRSMEMIDEKNREIDELKLTINSYSQTVTKYQLRFNDLGRMKWDYHFHRGRFGGTGVADEIDSILNGDGYIQAEVEG
jgi:hypothetical protein